MKDILILLHNNKTMMIEKVLYTSAYYASQLFAIANHMLSCVLAEQFMRMRIIQYRSEAMCSCMLAIAVTTVTIWIPGGGRLCGTAHTSVLCVDICRWWCIHEWFPESG